MNPPPMPPVLGHVITSSGAGMRNRGVGLSEPSKNNSGPTRKLELMLRLKLVGFPRRVPDFFFLRITNSRSDLGDKLLSLHPVEPNDRKLVAAGGWGDDSAIVCSSRVHHLLMLQEQLLGDASVGMGSGFFVYGQFFCRNEGKPFAGGEQMIRPWCQAGS